MFESIRLNVIDDAHFALFDLRVLNYRGTCQLLARSDSDGQKLNKLVLNSRSGEDVCGVGK